jgi:hypothetical protein
MSRGVAAIEDGGIAIEPIETSHLVFREIATDAPALAR